MSELRGSLASGKNKLNRRFSSGRRDSVIELSRTDTALDLSLEAKGRYSEQGGGEGEGDYIPVVVAYV